VLVGVGVADRVRQHRTDAELVSQAHGARGQPQRSRPGALTPQVHSFQPQLLSGELPPRREQLLGDVGAAGGQGPHRFGSRAEQHHQVLVGIGAQGGPGHDRRRAVGLGVCGGHQAAQASPPAGVLREQGDPKRRLDHMRTSAHGRTRPTGRGWRGERQDGDVDTEDRANAGGRGGGGEASGARDGIPVGKRKRRHPALGSALHKSAGEGGTVTGGVSRGDAQMSKSTASHLRLSRVLPDLGPLQVSTITMNRTSVRIGEVAVPRLAAIVRRLARSIRNNSGLTSRSDLLARCGPLTCGVS
jgi:hypothetical protein